MNLGVKLMIAGGIAFVVSVIGLVYAVISLTGAAAATPEFEAPGSFSSTTKEAGNYYVWDSFQTSFDGEIVNRPEALPDGYRVSVSDPAGEELPFTFDHSMVFSVGSHKMKSVGYVAAPADTTLTIDVDGFEEPFRVVSFARSSFRDIVFKAVLPFFAAIAVGAVGGILVLVGFVVWLVNRNREQTAEVF